MGQTAEPRGVGRLGRSRVLGAAGGGGSGVGEGEQPTDPAGDGVFAHRRVGPGAELFEGGLRVGQPQPAGVEQMRRRVGTEHGQGGVDPRGGGPPRQRGPLLVRPVEPHRRGGPPRRWRRCAVLPGACAGGGADAVQQRDDLRVVGHGHPPPPVRLAAAGGHPEPAGRAHQRQGHHLIGDADL